MSLAAVMLSHVTWFQVALLTLTLVLVWRWLRWRRYQLPPGPRALPLLGNTLDLRGVNFREKLDQWRAHYGPVFLFYMGPRPAVVISSIDALTEAYSTRGTDFSSKPIMTSLKVLSGGYKDIAFAPYSDTLVAHRKLVMQAVRQYLTGDQLSFRVNEAVLEEMSTISLTPDPAKTPDDPAAIADLSAPFDPRPRLMHIVFNVLHGICFGSGLKADDPAFLSLVDKFDDSNEDFMTFREDLLPVLRHIWPSKKFTDMIKDTRVFHGYLKEQKRKNQDVFDENHITNLTQHLILANKQAEAEDKYHEFTEEHIVMVLADVFFAGIDTTRRTLDVLFLHLARHPDTQARLYQEVKDVVGASVPGRAHRPQMVLLESVISETLRLYPPAPYGLMHTTSRDTKLMGYDIPPDCLILADLLNIQRDPGQWTKGCEFQPDRFLDDQGQKLATRPRSWIPFSFGPRACIGENLARGMLTLVTAGILQKVKVTLAQGEDARISGVWFARLVGNFQVHFSPR